MAPENLKESIYISARQNFQTGKLYWNICVDRDRPQALPVRGKISPWAISPQSSIWTWLHNRSTFQTKLGPIYGQ